jgi:ribonuclease VapC
MNELATFVFDSFALLALFQDEPGGPRVGEILSQAASGRVRIAMTVANLGEVVYRTAGQYGSDRADQVLGLISDYVIDMIDIDRALALEAAQFKIDHKMSYADCMAAALTQRLGAILVTGDPEFQSVTEFTIEWLPQRQRS